jgi:hypothetical protein
VSVGRAFVSGMVAGDPGHGGATWAVLQYVLGLRQLGWDTWLVEPVEELTARRRKYFDGVVARFGIAGRSALVRSGSTETHGASHATLRRAAAGADVLLNVSGMLTDVDLLEPIASRVYLDLDPGFNQLWHESGDADLRFDGHTRFATVGLLVGGRRCAVPTLGLEWVPTLPPVVLAEWAQVALPAQPSFTTVGNWRSYGSIRRDGVTYGQKAHSFRELLELPRAAGGRFEVALGIHPGDHRDREALERNGWHVVDPRRAVGSPDHYARFIGRSTAELGVAKSGYVVSRCGFFSERSACYLASGRPVVAQDTGFAEVLPTGDGLFSFAGVEDATTAIDAIRASPSRHSGAARDLAAAYFDSDRVLSLLLDRIGDRAAA